QANRALTRYCSIEGATLFAVDSVYGGECSFLFISDELLDPAFDDDFTHLTDDGRVFKRGGYPYRRLYALKVKGQYENDIWFETPHHRTERSPGEWPVFYHGTKEIASIKIAGGYDGDKCSADAKFGQGHYSHLILIMLQHIQIHLKWMAKNTKLSYRIE
uniref:Uncharacterized protein n=1 Tax=Amphimedon queenslandica TaxID=400682 RepID=A0A1X7T767_AMPQE